VIIVLGGLVAGFINTIAGSGSLITLPILIFIGGLPEVVANGTNRFGVIFQTFIGWRKLSRKEEMNVSLYHLIPSLIGAIIGVVIALEVDKDTFRFVLISVMILMLGLTVFNGKAWINGKTTYRKTNKIIGVIMFLTAGIYGGFIQAGIGIVLLSILVLYNGFSLNAANAIKNLVVLVYSIPVFLVFLYKGKVDWECAIILTVGQSAGALIAANFATKVKNAQKITRYLLIVILVVALTKLLGFI
jgi:hypothetical protein